MTGRIGIIGGSGLAELPGLEAIAMREIASSYRPRQGQCGASRRRRSFP
jgi:purine nucleoside phosphorylase